MDEFRAGVTACLRSWSALRTAVESGWGGRESFAKAEAIRSYILDTMTVATTTNSNRNSTTKQCSYSVVEDIEDYLAIYLEEEFSVTLEDGSERQVAECIWRLYESCLRGDYALVHQMVTAAEHIVQQCAALPPPQIQSTEHDDEDDDEGDEDGAGDESAPNLVMAHATTTNSGHDDVDMMDATEIPAVAGVGELHQGQEPNGHLSPYNKNATTNKAWNAREYGEQYLFGAPSPVRLMVHHDHGPVRQLGQTMEPTKKSEEQLDEDGFAPVTTKSKRKPR